MKRLIFFVYYGTAVCIHPADTGKSACRHVVPEDPSKSGGRIVAEIGKAEIAFRELFQSAGYVFIKCVKICHIGHLIKRVCSSRSFL